MTFVKPWGTDPQFRKVPYIYANFAFYSTVFLEFLDHIASTNMLSMNNIKDCQKVLQVIKFFSDSDITQVIKDVSVMVKKDIATNVMSTGSNQSMQL